MGTAEQDIIKFLTLNIVALTTSEELKILKFLENFEIEKK